MIDYTASNGVIVRVHDTEIGQRISTFDDDPAQITGYTKTSMQTYLDPRQHEALREFFQHEKDEEHGLWRSAKDRTWTAVRRNTVIYFQNEDHERSFHFVPKLEASIKAWSNDLQALAYEYIEAHPERKPWEDAKPGEHWELTAEGGTREYVAILSNGKSGEYIRFFPIADLHAVTLGVGATVITSGRRIWPEGDAS